MQLDGTVLLFALVVSVLTGLFFGTLPGLPSAETLARTSGSEGRAAGGRGGQRTRAALVVSQLALSFTLLIGAALMLEQIRGDALAPPKLTTALLGAFASVALLIAVTGLAGVLAYAVSQRTREIGVRVALGAAPAHILSLVLRQGLTSIALGLAIGLTGALALSRLVSRLLFGVAPTDPLCFIGSVAVLAAAGLVACLVPARRAVGIEPMRALRTE